MTGDLVVIKMDRARALLAEAKDARAAKKVADLARAAQVYAQRQQLGETCIGYARELKIEALAMLGEFLQDLPKNAGTRSQPIPPGPGRGRRVKTGSTKTKPPVSSTPTLKKQGIDKRESSEAQVIARAKKANPQLYADLKAGKKRVAQARVELKREEKRAELKRKAAAAEPSPNGKKAPAPPWKITHGDCVQVLAGLRERPRLIFCDPPYNLGLDYGEGKKADQLPTFDYLKWCAEWMTAAHRVLADDGSMWVLINHEHAAFFELMLRGDVLINYKDPSAGSAARIFDNLPGAAFSVLAGMARFHVRGWITWHETFGVNCSNGFNRCSRRLLYLVKDTTRFVFHPDPVSRPSARQVVYNDGRAAAAGKLWDDVWTIPRLVGTAKERIPDFPTQLPLELLRPIIACSTDPGDLVLDPFSGSATTGAAALELGRGYLGIEKSRRFADLSRARLKGMRPCPSH